MMFSAQMSTDVFLDAYKTLIHAGAHHYSPPPESGIAPLIVIDPVSWVMLVEKLRLIEQTCDVTLRPQPDGPRDTGDHPPWEEHRWTHFEWDGHRVLVQEQPDGIEDVPEWPGLDGQ